MAAPNWTQTVVEPILNFAEAFPAAFLRALLVRLEGRPEAGPAVSAAIDDHAAFVREAIMREARGNDAAAAEASAQLAAILKDHHTRK